MVDGRVQDNVCHKEEDNIFFKKEELIKYLIENNISYDIACEQWDEDCYEYNKGYKATMDGEKEDFDPSELLKEMGIHGKPEYPELINEYEMKIKELQRIIHIIMEEGKMKSLFAFYFFTDDGNLRKYSFKEVRYKNIKVLCNDIWTQGILYELYRIRFEKSMMGDIYSAPEILKQIPICY